MPLLLAVSMPVQNVWAHTRTLEVGDGLTGRGRGLGEMGEGEQEGAKLARVVPSRKPGDGEALGPQVTYQPKTAFTHYLLCLGRARLAGEQAEQKEVAHCCQ